MMRLQHRAAIGAVVLAAIAGACDTAVDPGDSAGISPSCMEALEHSDLEWIQTEIFDRSCVFSACHKGAAASAGDLNLETGMSMTNLVDVPSDLDPALDLVEPGDPDNSYLMVILGHPPGTVPSDVGTMPFGSALLCEEKLDAIQRWIESL